MTTITPTNPGTTFDPRPGTSSQFSRGTILKPKRELPSVATQELPSTPCRFPHDYVNQGTPNRSTRRVSFEVDGSRTSNVRTPVDNSIYLQVSVLFLLLIAIIMFIFAYLLLTISSKNPSPIPTLSFHFYKGNLSAFRPTTADPLHL